MDDETEAQTCNLPRVEQLVNDGARELNDSNFVLESMLLNPALFC